MDRSSELGTKEGLAGARFINSTAGMSSSLATAAAAFLPGLAGILPGITFVSHAKFYAGYRFDEKEHPSAFRERYARAQGEMKGSNVLPVKRIPSR